MKDRLVLYPANRELICREVLVDDLPSIRLWGKRFSDKQEGWFYFSPILGSYHAVLPSWVETGDEVEFFETTSQGKRASLLLPGIKAASGSVSRLFLDDGNILLFSNIAGVHRSYHLLKPQDLEGLHEIIVDLVYLEEPCPQCGSAKAFHYDHVHKPKSFSKCLNCGYDWKGRIQSELILVKKRMEERVAHELELHPHLKEMLQSPSAPEHTPEEDLSHPF